MASEIKIKVFMQSGDEQEIETPTDIRGDDFLRELVIALNLPSTDADGHPINWRLDNKDTGRTLDVGQTLEQAGVRDGHRLSLLRAVIAGGA